MPDHWLGKVTLEDRQMSCAGRTKYQRKCSMAPPKNGKFTSSGNSAERPSKWSDSLVSRKIYYRRVDRVNIRAQDLCGMSVPLVSARPSCQCCHPNTDCAYCLVVRIEGPFRYSPSMSD